MNSKTKIQRAREFRKIPTPTEKMLWQKLRRNNFCGLYWRRQHIIDGYIVDFYCASMKLAVEIDGKIHERQIKEDQDRQRIIESYDVKFFRITTDEVMNNINKVLIKLKNFIDILQKS